MMEPPLIYPIELDALAIELVGDDHVRSVPDRRVGVLAGIRRCSFKHPVLPGKCVRIEARSRQMSATAAFVAAELRVGARHAASVEILVINTQHEVLAAGPTAHALEPSASLPATPG